MDFEIAGLMACCFIVGAVAEHFRGRNIVEDAIERAETETTNMQAAIARFDRRASNAEPPVPGQGKML